MCAIDDNWDFGVDIDDFEQKSFADFQTQIMQISGSILMMLAELRGSKLKYNGNLIEVNDAQLKTLVERNKQLRHDIDKKFEELAKHKEQYENFKRERKLLSQEIKETHEAFLMAKKYYKKFLKMYYTIESKNSNGHTVFVQFFTESKKEGDQYSVRLFHKTTTRHYELLDMNPKLEAFNQLQMRLQQTNDLPETLCYIREAFCEYKNKKQ